MKKKKQKIDLKVAIAVIAVVLVIGLIGFAKADSTFLDRVAQYAGTILGNNLSNKIDLGELGEKSFGALTGPILPYNYFGFGDVVYMNVPQTMMLATTTLCAFENPFDTASSTLIDFTYQITVGTSTAATMVLATSTSVYSTSSAPFVAARTVASGAQDSSVFLPAAGYNGNGSIIGPNEYVLLKTEGVGLGGYTYTGNCKATFRGF